MVMLYDTELDDNGHPELVEVREIASLMAEVRSPDDIDDLMKHEFRLHYKTEERVYMICRNSAGRVVGVFEIAHGTVDYAVIKPRDIFTKLLLSGAVDFVLIHNHPSGKLDPSPQDDEIAERLVKLGSTMGVPLRDFMIVGRYGYMSYSESGRMPSAC